MAHKVGQSSSRTPFKHEMLNWVLGKTVGALTSGKTPLAIPSAACPALLIDLCGGDGQDNPDSRTCSIAKLEHHATHLRNLYGEESCKVIIYEHHYISHQLQKEHHGGHPFTELRFGDARTFNLRKEMTTENQLIFINADPNSIADMPLVGPLADSLTPFTTFICTLGCNPGGLKMAPLNLRENWHRFIEPLLDRMPSFHDMHLYALEKDASQWAYMLRMPRKWSLFTQEMLSKKGEKLWPKVACLWGA